MASQFWGARLRSSRVRRAHKQVVRRTTPPSVLRLITRPIGALLAPLGACLLMAALVACTAGPPDGSAPRWEPLASLTASCPSLDGTYTLAPTRVPLSQTVLGDLAMSSGRKYPWESMTIAGNADDSLVVTLARSERQRAEYRDALFAKGAYYEKQYRQLHRPDVRWSSGFATMTDSAYEANLETLALAPTRTQTLRRGSEYVCTDGWVRVDRVVRDPGPDRSNPRPDTVIGVVLLRRGTNGALVARADYKDEIEFSLWCGDGCTSVSFGTQRMRQWGRWDAAPAPANGVVARPWAEPFDPPLVRPASGASSSSPNAIAEELRAFLPPDVRLTEVAPDADGFRVQLVSRNTTPFTQLMRALRRSYRFRHERVVGLSRDTGGDWRLALDLGDIWVNSPANPHNPTRALLQALPPTVTWSGTNGAGKGLEVTLVAKEQREMDHAIRAIERLTEYQDVRVKSSIRSSVDQAIVTVVYVRERAAR